MTPPSGDSYTLLSNLYAYSIEACIGLLLAAGLLYERYNKDGVHDQQWKTIRGFTPWFGPVIPIFYLLTNIILVCVPWMHSGESIIMKSIPWFVFPTVAVSVFAAGFVYWVIFRFIVPPMAGYVLHVQRVPYFDGKIFVLEAVYSKWVSLCFHSMFIIVKYVDCLRRFSEREQIKINELGYRNGVIKKLFHTKNLT